MRTFLAVILLSGCGAAQDTEANRIPIDPPSTVTSALVAQDGDGSDIGDVLGVTGTYDQLLLILDSDGRMFALNDQTGFIGGSAPTTVMCSGSQEGGYVSGPYGPYFGTDCHPFSRPQIVRMDGDGGGWSEPADTMLKVFGVTALTGCGQIGCAHSLESVTFPTSFKTPIKLVRK